MFMINVKFVRTYGSIFFFFFFFFLFFFFGLAWEGFGCDTSLQGLGFGRLELEVNSDRGPRELK